MIFCDIDGVIRNIISVTIGKEPDIWHHKDGNGQNIVDIINKDLDLLIKAPPYDYLKIINAHEVTLLSHQPIHWRPYTLKWVEKHTKSDVIFVDSPVEKLDHVYLNDGILIEDYPFLPDYSRIILIDRLYNQGLAAMSRVRSTKELQEDLARFA